MPLIETVPLTALLVGSRAELLRNGQHIGPQLAQRMPVNSGKWCRRKGFAIVNRSVVVNSLCVVNVLHGVFLVQRRPLGLKLLSLTAVIVL